MRIITTNATATPIPIVAVFEILWLSLCFVMGSAGGVEATVEVGAGGKISVGKVGAYTPLGAENTPPPIVEITPSITVTEVCGYGPPGTILNRPEVTM
jgi:hypothetical protein